MLLVTKGIATSDRTLLGAYQSRPSQEVVVAAHRWISVDFVLEAWPLLERIR